MYAKRLLVAISVGVTLVVSGVPAAASEPKVERIDRPSRWDECPMWAWYMRPDTYPVLSGNAGDWARQARKRGFPVSRSARRGDILVMRPGQAGAGSVGHVAYVEQMRGTTIFVSETNWGGGGTRARPRPITSSRRFVYIHRKR